MAVTVGVEEEGGGVVLEGIAGGKGLADQGACGRLTKKLSRMADRTTDEEEIAGFGHGGAAAAEVVDQQVLLIEVVEGILGVDGGWGFDRGEEGFSCRGVLPEPGGRFLFEVQCCIGLLIA